MEDATSLALRVATKQLMLMEAQLDSQIGSAMGSGVGEIAPQQTGVSPQQKMERKDYGRGI